MLESGVDKFKNDVFPGMQDRFQELENGQSPETLFITCSDSRINPNLVTQTEPGELFVIRNAGNMVPEPGTGELAVEATIEYAVKALGVKRIVVCGHSHCGAVTGLLQMDSLGSLPAVKRWVNKCRDLLSLGDLSIEDAIRKNVQLQLDRLMEYDYVAAAVEEGKLELQGWIYHFEKGDVEYVHTADSAIA